MAKGEIWHVRLLEGVGHEQTGSRPAIIYGARTGGMIVVVPLTTNMSRANLGYTETMKATSANGLREDSVALAFQIVSISTDRLVSKLGMTEGPHIRNIDAMIRDMLSLS